MKLPYGYHPGWIEDGFEVFGDITIEVLDNGPLKKFARTCNIIMLIAMLSSSMYRIYALCTRAYEYVSSRELRAGVPTKSFNMSSLSFIVRREAASAVRSDSGL